MNPGRTVGVDGAKTSSRSRDSALSRAFAVYGRSGGRGVWFAALEQTIYRRLLILQRDLVKPVIKLSAKTPIELKTLTTPGAAEDSPLQPGLEPGVVRARLEAGHSCTIALHRGEAVGSCWVASGTASIPYLDYVFPVAPGEAYLYELYTKPGMRGRNIATALLVHDIQRLRDAGFARAVAAVLPDNRHVLGPFDKTRWRPVGTVRRVGVWRLQHHFYRPRREQGYGPALPSNLRRPPRAARAVLRIKSELALLGFTGEDVVSRARWGAAGPKGSYADRRPLAAVVVHHSGVPAAHLRDSKIRAEAAYMRGIQMHHRSRGWFDIGYHFVVMPSGRVFAGRPLWALGAHVVGHNRGTVGLCLAGDFDLERPTQEALISLDSVLADLIPGGDAVPLVGHRDLADTSCPGGSLYAFVRRHPGRRIAGGPYGSLSPRAGVASKVG